MSAPLAHRLVLVGRTILPTVLVALLAGWLFAQAALPLPWMIGPLLTLAGLRLAGVPWRAVPGGRRLGQALIGTALGLYFTPLVVAELWQHLPLILLLAVSSLGVGLLAALLLLRLGQVNPVTAFFASLPGGASEMVVLAERHGGKLDRVAAAQALRVVLVVCSVPFVLHHWASEGTQWFIAGNRVVSWLHLPLLVAVAAVGIWLLQRLRIANAWMLGPLFAVGVSTAAGVTFSALPPWLVNVGQVLLGSALGCRFSPDFFRAAPRFLCVSGLATGLTLVLSGGLAVLCAVLYPLPWPSLLLAASPGGMAEMSVTAREMHFSVPLVTAAHVTRVIVITVAAPLLCQRLIGWLGRRIPGRS